MFPARFCSTSRYHHRPSNPMTRCVAALCCVLMVSIGLAAPALAQDIPEEDVPPSVQRELDRQGMTAAEARTRARQLGVDLSNPEQAARRLREIGIPEARIQVLLEAVEAEGLGQAGTFQAGVVPSSAAPFVPMLTARPIIEPDTVSTDSLPKQVRVQVSLRSEDIIRVVEPFFLTAGGDTSAVRGVRRTRGSVIDGLWEGRIVIPRDTTVGTWTLFVRASTEDTTVTLPTGRRLFILPPEEIAKRDSARAGRDSLKYFGYDVFNTIPDVFRPSPTGPVDDSYVVGPNDELRLTVWGGAEFQYELTVDQEGRVFVPNVGQFTASGKTLSELRQQMRQWLSRSYSGLTSDPPSVFMDLTVTRVRPVQVFVLGEVAQPGGYTVGSYATVFNALYSVGGPLRRGSLRNIQIIRNGELVATVDLYDYLLRGYSSERVQLQSNDYIFIPPRGETVAIRGAVKRPAYYEMKPGETVSDLIRYAGGLEPQAYTKRFQINRIVPFDERTDASVARRVLDFSLDAARSEEGGIALADGDEVRILSILDQDRKAVAKRVDAATIAGAVFQPGRYELTDNVRTVRDLIERADGLTGDAYQQRAALVRIEDNLEESIRSLNLTAVMDDDPTANIVLQPGDSIFVASTQVIRSRRQVRITGQVRQPGDYRLFESMTVQDLLFKGGGLADSEYLKTVFLDRADLFRTSPDGKTERVIPFHLGDALNGDGFADETLLPGDEVRIYKASLERLEERFVFVSGAVRDTGQFSFRDNMTLKDLLVQAQGFQEGASLQSVEVTRMVRDFDGEGERARTIQVPLGGSTSNVQDVNFSVRDTSQVLQAASRFQLQHRDRVYVRIDPGFRPQETVVVRGEVQFPGEYTLLRENEMLSDVIERAGGIRSTGYLNGGRLVRGNEQVIVEMERAIRGGRRGDVILQPGDEIVVPSQPNTVAIRGNVANEGLVRHEPGRRVSYYLERAGGLRENTEAIFITQASGATFRVKTGWFRRTPKVDDGAIIRVTEQPEEENGRSIDVGQTITESLGIISSALTIIVLAGRAFN